MKFFTQVYQHFQRAGGRLRISWVLLVECVTEGSASLTTRLPSENLTQIRSLINGPRNVSRGIFGYLGFSTCENIYKK